MRTFNRDGPRRNFAPRGPREMHKATCAKCGMETEVPFKPSNDPETGKPRPVYCRECYMAIKNEQTKN